MYKILILIACGILFDIIYLYWTNIRYVKFLKGIDQFMKSKGGDHLLIKVGDKIQLIVVGDNTKDLIDKHIPEKKEENTIWYNLDRLCISSGKIRFLLYRTVNKNKQVSIGLFMIEKKWFMNRFVMSAPIPEVYLMSKRLIKEIYKAIKKGGEKID